MFASRVISSALHPMQNTLQICHATQLRGRTFRRFHLRAVLYYASRKRVDRQKGARSEISFTNLNVSETLENETPTDFSTLQSGCTTENASSVGSHRPQKRLEELYPEPVNFLHGFFQTVANELSRKDAWSLSYKKFIAGREMKWECSYNIAWPESMRFVESGKNKSIASKKAALKCIHWLEQKGKLKDGKTHLYTQSEIRKIKNRPVELSIPDNFLNEMEQAVEIFECGIQKILDTSRISHDYNPEFTNTMQNTYERSNPYQYNYDELIKRIRERKTGSQTLPIFKFKEEIVNHIHHEQILLIRGDTGCGKTTQVPQFILDEYIERHQITDCNIIVSQPRRISAISLARRIAEERREELGDTIGYQVRLEQVLPRSNHGIRFCTTGILLRKLQFNPNMEGFSHVILDEAHERSIENDMLMVLLKRALLHNRSLKLIVMSATINSELFQNYFHSPVVEVPGFLHPVKMNFLDEMQEINICSRSVMKKSDRDVDVDHYNITKLITWICRNKPPGAILCFLPGWADIVLVWNLLRKCNLNTVICPIHSKLSHREQQQIFSPVQHGLRKIILATDIAETGITVNDVVYVVDSAIKKELRWDEENCVSCIDYRWVSQANIMQRKGRAGRVQPGESFHFISRDKYRSIEPYPQSEVLRAELEKTILDSKKYGNQKARDFFACMPESPSENAIRSAVNNLRNLNAIDDEEDLTVLGKRMLYFTLHPRLSKAIVYSSIFNCIESVTTIVSQHSTDDKMFANTLINKYVIREKKKLYNQTSDHIAMLDIYNRWESKSRESQHTANMFCEDMEVVPSKLRTLRRIRSMNIEHLEQSKMVSNEYARCHLTQSFSNDHSSSSELIKAILFSATNQLIRERNFTFRNGRFSAKGTEFTDLNFQSVYITQDSVNFKRQKGLSPFLTYIYSLHCNQRRMSLVRETSSISPLAVFLFSREFIKYLNKHSTNDDNEDMVSISIGNHKLLNFSSNERTITLLSKFRSILWDVVDYILQREGICKPEDQADLDAVVKYKNELLFIIAEMLRVSSKSINTNKDLEQDSESSEAM